MRLPKFFYEWLPLLYIISGLLFFLGVGYLSLRNTMSPIYLAAGGFCLGTGIALYILRKHCRERDQKRLLENAQSQQEKVD